MGINIKQLSPAAQAQALRKIAEQDKQRSKLKNSATVAKTGLESAQKQVTGKLNKYNAEKVESGEIKFDSRKEADRYAELCMMLKSGDISDLRLQETFVLQRAYTTVEGKRIRAISYIADFTYREDGKYIVEDVKGYRGGNAYQTFKTKKKLMQSVHGIEVKEI